VFLLEFRDGKLARTTNVLPKAHDLLLPDYRKSKAEPYNDNFDFIFDGEYGPVFKLDGANRVIINGDATTDPEGNLQAQMVCAAKGGLEHCSGKVHRAEDHKRVINILGDLLS
jgi:hypothetical protein